MSVTEKPLSATPDTEHATRAKCRPLAFAAASTRTLDRSGMERNGVHRGLDCKAMPSAFVLACWYGNEAGNIFGSWYDWEKC
ncbi:unnamed protein product [Hermetia illucens]|uniref:Uncharacterized protein n=1 Tax=Hermetia illucens TaxID=343691 RepID=A0A7R8UP58_HERIL|nr:unnamed protein product [Hermetia illucens]